MACCRSDVLIAMLSMYRFVLLVLFAAAISAQAKEPDYRSYFTYPDVQITVDYGDQVGHAQTIPFKNHVNYKSPAKKTTFQGGWQMSGNRPDNPRVQ